MSTSTATGAPAADPFLALGVLDERVNVAAHLRARAAEAPERAAVRTPVPGARGRWRDTSYAELESRTDHLARALAHAGVVRGDRACVFVRPGVELIALTYALFKLGAAPVLIDPGMGRRALLACVERTAPRVFLGIPRAQLARRLFPRAFRSVEIALAVGARALGGASLAALLRATASQGGRFPIADTRADEVAAVLFTSGSTGPPKGAVYTQGIFDAQRLALRAMYGLAPGEVDAACFPLFALFDTALGLTSVFPELDPSRPGQCDPTRIAAAVQETGATLSFGSPAIWRRVAPHCAARGERLAGLERVLIAGAPVPPRLVAELHAILGATGDVHTPFGATEALPVASLSGREILALRARSEGGAGTCVGRLAPGIELALVAIHDRPLAQLAPEHLVAPGEAGEICVRGPVVTQCYQGDAAATTRAKIAPAEGRQGPGRGAQWHRMGDVGRLDEEGRLWFHGRVAHRIETPRGLLLPVPIENVYNTCAGVRRSALVGVGPSGAKRPVLVVEEERGAPPRGDAARKRAAAILAAGAARAPDVGLADVLFHQGFPVDVRHNAKIDRGELAHWAEDRLA